MNIRAHVEDSLRRVEDLVKGLEKVKDPAARLAARQLFEAVLDLHGLALAKITARLAADDRGMALYQDMGADEQVKAVLLLYGLHPHSAEERVRAAIGALQEQYGVSIRLLSVGDGIARLVLNPGPNNFDDICRVVGAALIDAAPDLDDVAIDSTVPAEVGEMPRAAAAG